MRTILIALATAITLPAIADAQQRQMRAAPEPEDRGIVVCTLERVEVTHGGTTLICDDVIQSDWNATTQAFFAPAEPDRHSPNADSVATVGSTAMIRGSQLRMYYYNPHVVGTDGCARNPCRRLYRVTMQ
ncbi:hypothetical protein [Maricaulis sp.]|uniref:hypothetical protein n=1 Tax=Maricaulis sp. TaxID=1486257 RepID=UPI002607EE13|nr:hypothetical protein [Maricaulis sp.]